MKHNLVQTIIPDNNYLVCRKVMYQMGPKVHADDTSSIFYEVINSESNRFVPGTLIKTNLRTVNEMEIEGETISLIDKSLVYCHIKPEDVKTDLLKR